jgi:Tol biopolymer transport system component
VVPVTGELAYVSTRDGGQTIYVANADGSGATRLTEGSAPAWSWDGRKIVFVRRPQGASVGEIHVLDLDSRQVSYVVDGDHPAWSPDGRIVFMRGAAIYSMNPDGSEASEGLNAVDLWDDFGFIDSNGWPVANYSLRHPIPSPDGRSIAFLWSRRPDPEKGESDSRLCLGIVDAATFAPRELGAFCNPEAGTAPVWSPPVWTPDGSAVAVFTGPGTVCGPSDWSPLWWTCGASDRTSVLYRYELSSAEPEAIYATRFGSHANNPAWHPNGTHLAFDAYPSTQEPLVRRVFTRSTETGEVRQLDFGFGADAAVAEYEDYDPAWSQVIP